MCWPNVADHGRRANNVQNATGASSRRSVHLLCSASRLLYTLFFRLATCMALNCMCINMAFSLFIIPLLIFGSPYFSLTALATGEWPVEVKSGRPPYVLMCESLL